VAAAILILGTLYYFFVYQPATVSEQKITGPESNAPANISNGGETKSNQNDQADQVNSNEDVIVDVKGEIKQPGVYHANKNERVIDVIERAGGLTEKADQKQVNFAAHVQDEMVIYIPAKGETVAEAPVTGSGSAVVKNDSPKSAGKININKADENELQNLPGIGTAKAADIIQYRQEHGLFKSIEDLKNISGIGDKTFEKLKESISVN
jgi:competence protein ComEA